MDTRIVDHPAYGPTVRLCRGHATALVGLRGGQVLTWTHGGREQLYLSGRSRHSAGASIRGGIPVIFPQFADHGPGPRHGFARTSTWSVADEVGGHGDEGRVRLRLHDGPATLSAWPHRFSLEQSIALDDGGLDIVLEVRNTDDHAWAFSAALHSYWRIEPGDPVTLGQLAGAAFVDRSATGCRSPAHGPLTMSAEIERLYRDAPADVVLGDRRTLRFSSDGWRDLMVWNPGPEKGQAMGDLDPAGEQAFLCVEPLCYDPLWLRPGAAWVARHRVTAE